MPTAERADRRRRAPQEGHHRSPWQRDRDRIQYTDALQRLAAVTQVASPEEGLILHNRLTHTYEVAQIARRLAEKLLAEQSELARRLGGLDPDVVEAAALAHDLGHPPFGHVAEHELDLLGRRHGAPEGFEGNAQSFRILVRIAEHNQDYPGLDLTRATLNAVLKYPWFRDLDGERTATKKWRKYGAYRSDEDDFHFARQGWETSEEQSLEAAIMDHADAIAYSVHDLEDFYRAGLIPLGSLATGTGEWDWFISRWKAMGPKIPPEVIDASAEEFQDLISPLTTGAHYSGESKERALLRTATSGLINDFVHGVRLDAEAPAGLWRDPQQEKHLRFLQALVWVYVIRNPRLATQQHGQRQIVRSLFHAYLGAIKRRERDFVPALFRAEVDALALAPDENPEERAPTEEETRTAIDIVAHFSDAQAVLVHRRLSGTSPGSITEILHA